TVRRCTAPRASDHVDAAGLPTVAGGRVYAVWLQLRCRPWGIHLFLSVQRWAGTGTGAATAAERLATPSRIGADRDRLPVSLQPGDEQYRPHGSLLLQPVSALATADDPGAARTGPGHRALQRRGPFQCHLPA